MSKRRNPHLTILFPISLERSPLAVKYICGTIRYVQDTFYSGDYESPVELKAEYLRRVLGRD
jgi:hypothetical protein